MGTDNPSSYPSRGCARAPGRRSPVGLSASFGRFFHSSHARQRFFRGVVPRSVASPTTQIAAGASPNSARAVSHGRMTHPCLVALGLHRPRRPTRSRRQRSAASFSLRRTPSPRDVLTRTPYSYAFWVVGAFLDRADRGPRPRWWATRCLPGRAPPAPQRRRPPAGPSPLAALLEVTAAALGRRHPPWGPR